ncbi:MAG: amino acid ABC transporter permease [Pseudomonadota bacterium]
MTYEFQFGVVFDNIDALLFGAWLTTKLSLTAIALGLGVGILGALARTSSVKPLRWIAGAYVEAIRNTPFLVQLFIVFFGLPSIGVKMTAGQAALGTMVMNLGAYSTEIVRAGIEAIPKGQIEAGLSLGLSKLHVIRYIVMFPALKIVYPALASQFVLLMLASSVVSQISAEELTFAAHFLQSRTYRSFEIYFVITFMYLGLALMFRALFHAIHAVAFRRHRRGSRRGDVAPGVGRSREGGGDLLRAHAFAPARRRGRAGVGAVDGSPGAVGGQRGEAPP